ncbi:MAG: NAD(P)-binding domain-containing protein [Devosia sp.]
MKTVDVVIIGAGQAGLAMSRELTLRSVDHVVLERGQVANSWRTERWDSLRLISPNWMNGLPGHPYNGADRDGFMSAQDLAETFDRFVAHERVPVETGTTVNAVRATSGGYRVETSGSLIDTLAVVVATGGAARSKVPPFASTLPADVLQVTPLTYKRPSDLPKGRVLVVGASASGVQIAREVQESGRPVMLAVGSHTRVPRRYRGFDIDVWMHLLGLFDVTIDEVDDLARVRRTPSTQLSGRNGTDDVDLNALQDINVEIAGRLMDARDGRMLFSGGLANACAAADLKMKRLIASIDEWVDANALSALIEPASSLPPTRVPAAPRLALDVKADDVRTVVWATGLQPDHTFIDLPVFDRKGQIRHDGGVVAPGLFVMGLPFLRRRKSHLIAGAGDDARDLADVLCADLNRRCAA